MSNSRCTCTDSETCRHPWPGTPAPEDDPGQPIGHGTQPPEWRPPTARPNINHATQGIVIGGVVMFQQSPPVHTTGARFDAAPLRTVLREISESRAARIIAEREALASGKATDKQRAAISRIDDGATPAAQRMRRLRARKAQP